jgi:hypothetical protein
MLVDDVVFHHSKPVEENAVEIGAELQLMPAYSTELDRVNASALLSNGIPTLTNP